MNKLIAVVIVLLITCTTVIAGDDKNTVAAVLKSVTVYRSGAELTHTTTAVLQKGNNDLVVEGLSNALDINSIQIGSAEKLTILSVTFSTDYLKATAKSASVKKLEDSLQVVARDIAHLQVMIKTNNEILEVLKANREIRGTQTGMSVTELMKMMDYYKTKTLETQNEIALYRDKESKLTETMQKIKSQIGEEEQKNNKTVGKLLLQVMSPLAGNCNLTISYITDKAYWTPSYDIRVDNISKPLNLIYKAKLVQTTGIDWKQVKLTLTSTSPNQNSTAPILKSWFLSYTNPVTRMENNLYMNSVQSMLQRKTAGLVTDVSSSEVAVTGFAKQSDDENKEYIKIRGQASLSPASTPLYVVNGNIMEQQQFEKIDPSNIKSLDVYKDVSAVAAYGSRAANGVIKVTLKEDLGDYVTVKDNELNISYDIDLPYDVPGNGKEQSVQLKESPVNAFYKYYAVPKLDKDSYLLGEIADWEKLNLLAGEANIIFEGTYIGKSYIDPNSTQDTINFTLGKDKRLVIKKEKLKDFSSVKFLGSNKKQVFTYEITVKNNKKEAVQLLLKDQYPLSSNKEIEVELLETSEAADNKELGVLTWKMQLEPGEVKKLRVGYSVKYPKDKYVNL